MISFLRDLSSWRRVALPLILAGAAALTACGGGGSEGGLDTPPAAPTALAVAHGVKTFNFTWAGSAGATSYRLFEDIDGAGGPQGSVVVGTSTTAAMAYAPLGLLHERLNAQYTVQACNSAGCSANSNLVQSNVNQAIGYFKASNTGAGDLFGSAVALSADGNTLAVGAFAEDSSAVGVNGTSTNNSDVDSGAVYVFARVAGAWAQQAYVKASNTGAADLFGSALAFSADGNTLAVGAPGEASINGSQADNSALGAGAVYIFTRTGAAWGQQAYVKASTIANANDFGRAVSLSVDGNTLAVGAPGGDLEPGTAYVFTRNSNAWLQQAAVNASIQDIGDHFGIAVALSSDGNTLAVGAHGEDSSSPTINGNDGNNSMPDAGAAYVFTRTGGTWSQQAYIKASHPGPSNTFGFAVALSGDGNTLAVGAPHDWSSATGVNGDEANIFAFTAGAVHVFSRTGATWTKQAYVKPSNTRINYEFGSALALSSDGNTLAVGAVGENSDALGLDGDQTSLAAGFSGAAYVFKRSSAAWTQDAYVKASNTETQDFFGGAVALSADGKTLAIGAAHEDSSATGINGNQADDSKPQAGAVYLY